MTGWGSGYVTDITYMAGYYRQQSPQMMTLASLLGGVAMPMPGPDDTVNYLELGCGQGFGALLLAASNPTWRVTAIDFNPAHIATARAWAAEAGIDNVRFIEADFATLAEDPASADVPEADFVSMHGVWSWVPPPVQAGIVRLLRAKVRPGGAVHVSYNALPAWGAAIGMQRILREAGRRLATRSDRQVEAGLTLIKELQAADATQLKPPWLTTLIGHMGELPVEYLAHEYMNDAWRPCFLADVAASLADAKLEWVGSLHLTENFPDLVLTPEQRAIARRFDDRLMQELVKDACLDRALRQDVFVRGARRISPAMRDTALMDVSLALNIHPDDMPRDAEMPAGRAALNPEFYRPITAAMAAGPRRVGDLLELPTLSDRHENPAELVGILVGLDLAEPAVRPGAEPGAAARRFNQVIARHMTRSENLARPIAAASHRLGMGAPCTVFSLYVLERVMAGEGQESIEAWVRHLGGNLDDGGRDRLRDVLGRSVRDRLPILRSAGVV